MVCLQNFFPDQNLTKLSEIEPPEASGKVANSLVFSGNCTDISTSYSTTRALIKILTVQILEYSLRSITQVSLSTKKVPRRRIVPTM